MNKLFIAIRRKLLTIIAGKMQVGINLKIEDGTIVTSGCKLALFSNVTWVNSPKEAIRVVSYSKISSRLPLPHIEPFPTSLKKRKQNDRST